MVNVPIKIRIRVNLSSPALLLVSLVGLCLLSSLAWRWAEAQQPDSLQAAAIMPSYYITDLSYYPDEALTACAAGYHFANESGVHSFVQMLLHQLLDLTFA